MTLYPLDTSETLILAGLVFVLVSMLEIRIKEYEMNIAQRKLCFATGVSVFYLGISSSQNLIMDNKKFFCFFCIFILAYFIYIISQFVERKFGKKYGIIIIFASIIIIFHSVNLLVGQYGNSEINRNIIEIVNNNNTIDSHVNANTNINSINSQFELWYCIVSIILSIIAVHTFFGRIKK